MAAVGQEQVRGGLGRLKLRVDATGDPVALGVERLGRAQAEEPRHVW
jgi:hypothetical protein